jgi:LacI family transcriptional regulator
MTTMADVARAAGVSVSTVSHVINGTRKVNADTERAVRQAMEATGYMHDQVARSLATGRTGIIGLAMSAISNPYFAEVAHVIERELSRAGYTLLLADTHDEAERELRAVGDLLSHRVDGVVLAPSPRPTAVFDQLARRKVPLVLIDRFAAAEVDQIAVENIQPTAMLVKHLADLGHVRIGMIAGSQGLATSEERVEGYQRGLEAASIPLAPELVARGNSEENAAHAAILQLLALAKPPTAVFVGNNRMTIGVMRGLRDAQMRVPADIALVAFDDFEWADLFHPRITAIAQPTVQMAEKGAAMLLERIADPALAPRRVRLQPAFVHRESCGCGDGSRDIGAAAATPSRVRAV